MVSLTIDAVGKKYGDVRAISDVSITVDDGEFLVLVGPSGCGKSTLLRMIAGLESLTEGRISFGDRDVNHVDPKDRDVAMVFQNYALYPHMSVYENMAFGLQQRKVPKEKIHESITHAARILDLDTLLDRKPNALSGGQRQRVAMGRAIVRNPAIYLMDEPLSNLDAKLRVQMRGELKILRARLGVTTVYVTHDQVEAMTLGDRVAVMAPYSPDQDTSLQQCDSPRRLYLEPYNMFVAGFIGSPAMNFLYADIEGSGKELLARIPGIGTALHLTEENTPAFHSIKAVSGKRLVMGIRPEFFALEPQGETEFSPSISADLLVSELVGPDTYLHFDLPTPNVGSALMEVLNNEESGSDGDTRYTARVSSEKFVGRDGGKLELFINVQRLHFFDEKTTNRIV